MKCSQCNLANPANNRFCGSCGRELSGYNDRRQGETYLFDSLRMAQAQTKPGG